MTRLRMRFVLRNTTAAGWQELFNYLVALNGFDAATLIVEPVSVGRMVAVFAHHDWSEDRQHVAKGMALSGLIEGDFDVGE